MGPVVPPSADGALLKSRENDGRENCRREKWLGAPKMFIILKAVSVNSGLTPEDGLERFSQYRLFVCLFVCLFAHFQDKHFPSKWLSLFRKQEERFYFYKMEKQKDCWTPS